MLAPALAVIAGVVAARLSPATPGAAVVAAAGLLVCLALGGWRLLRPPPSTARASVQPIKTTQAVLWAGFLCLGALRYDLAYHFFPPGHVVGYVGAAPRLAGVRGIIVSEPLLTEPASELVFTPIDEPQTVFTLRAEEVRCRPDWQPTSGLMQVVVQQPCPLLRLGQRVQIDGRLLARQGPANPGEPDRRDLYRATRNLVKLDVDVAAAVQVIGTGQGWGIKWIERRARWQRAAWRALLRGQPLLEAGHPQGDDVRAFLAALLLGERQRLSDDLNEAFLRTGTNHYLSVSGFHVGIVAALVWGLGWLLRLPRWVQGSLAFAGVVLYVGLVPEQAPILRAGIICAVFCLAFLARRPTNGLNLLALALLVVVLWRPLDVFAPGFQLSFIVTAAILVLGRTLSRSWRPDDPLAAVADENARHDAAPGTTRWIKAALRWSGRIVVGSLAVSVVAWLAGSPLVAFHFNRFAPWGALASLALAPLVCLAMCVGLIKMVLAAALPGLAGWLARPLWLLASACTTTVEALARLPASNINVASPPIWLVLTAYGLFASAAWSAWRSGAIPYAVRLGLAAWAAAFVCLLPFAPQPHALELHVLSVGPGCAAVVRLPDGQVICYDAGSLTRTDVGTRTVAAFLRRLGVNRVQALFLSHPNLDHYNGAAQLCHLIPVGGVYLSEYWQPLANSTARSALHELQRLAVPLHTVRRGSVLLPHRSADQPPYRLEVLWPGPRTPACALQANDASLVLRIADAHGALLLCGDLEALSQQLLLDLGPDQLPADVLLLPHHGSVAPTLAAFVQAVHPQLCLRSGGPLRALQQTRLVEALHGRPLLETSRSGALSVTCAADRVHWQTCRPDR